jgi:hypothetical protein
MYDFGHIRQTLHRPLGYVDDIPISDEVLVKSIELHRSIVKGRTLARLGSHIAGRDLASSPLPFPLVTAQR